VVARTWRTSPRFYTEIVKRLKAMAAFLKFLTANEGAVARRRVDARELLG
jgi:hypothetical protein